MKTISANLYKTFPVSSWVREVTGAALRPLLAAALVFNFIPPARALNVVFAFTNSSTGQLDTNSFVIWPQGSVRNYDGTFNNRGLPFRVQNPTGISTNHLVANYYQVTNQFIGDGFFIRVYDSSSTIVSAGDKSIYMGGANPFVELAMFVNTNAGAPIAAGTNISFATNSGVITISGNGGGSSYSAGSGITIASNVISVYSAPTVLTFVNNQNSLEIGTTVTNTLLTWTLGGADITRQAIDNLVGAVQTGLRSFTNAASYTTSRTYTLTVTDGVTTNTGATSVTFYSKIYWGASGQTASTITDGQIIALGGAYATARAMTQTITTANNYMFVCYPAAWGSATFTVNGFLETGWTLVTRNFQNASGGIVSYNIYQHPQPNVGNFAVQVQ